MRLEDLSRTLPRHASKRYSVRPVSRVDTIVVHHQGCSCGPHDQDTEDEVKAIARYHVDGHGWPGIGYHYVVAKDGRVWKTNPITAISYHTPGYNTRGIGIMLMGNFEHYPVPGAQAEALRELIETVEHGLGRPLHLVGHGQVWPTQCPGKYGLQAVKDILAAKEHNNDERLHRVS